MPGLTRNDTTASEDSEEADEANWDEPIGMAEIAKPFRRPWNRLEIEGEEQAKADAILRGEISGCNHCYSFLLWKCTVNVVGLPQHLAAQRNAIESICVSVVLRRNSHQIR